MAERRPARGPVQAIGEVLSVKTAGEYVHLTVVAAAVAERARPGAFVTLGVGGEASATLMPRPFWLHRARPAGAYGGTVEVAFPVHSPATRWLAGLRAHDQVPITGPVGKPFSLPKEPVSCALVGYGYGAAPLLMLAERLRERDCGVHVLLSADTERSLFAVLETRRASQSLTVVTAESPAVGQRSAATVLRKVLADHQVEVVFASGPLEVLHDVASVTAAAGVWSQLALEAPMACGVGLCMSCVVPIKGIDEVTRPLRCCVEGPVFTGEQVDWAMLRPQWT